MSVGTLTLNRFNGRQIYPITSAIIFVLPDEGFTDISLEIETSKAIETTTPDGMDVQPNAEVTFALPTFDASQFAGTHHDVPEGDVDGEWKGRLYYCEHEPLDNNHVHVVAEEDGGFRIKWTGDACDVNYYDGSKPRTQVEIDALFQFHRK